MINGTKLLNVAGMSRGKRDGILKNEKGRVVVKVGAMHLKGVWITFVRAKLLAAQYKIQEILYPLFVEDPSVFLYATALHNPINASRMNGLNGYRTQQYGSFNSSSSPSNAATASATTNASSINPTSPTSWDRHNNESNTSSKCLIPVRARLNGSLCLCVRACVYVLVLIIPFCLPSPYLTSSPVFFIPPYFSCPSLSV